MSQICDVVLSGAAWQGAGLDRMAERAAVAVLGHLDLGVSGYSIAVLGCDDEEISTLNSDFRGKAQPTNVLSWPSETRLPDDLPQPGTEEDPEEMGDIAIAYGTCQREAEAQGKRFEDHVTHLIIHGILHLLGYDHQEDDQAALMEGTETAILATLGIADPYV